MLEHHVYFWLKDEHQNAADRATFEAGLAKLLEIETVHDGLWGPPAPTPQRPVTDNSFDYALSLRFDDLAAHDAYQDCPAHDEFIASYKDWWAKVAVRDFQSG